MHAHTQLHTKYIWTHQYGLGKKIKLDSFRKHKVMFFFPHLSQTFLSFHSIGNHGNIHFLNVTHYKNTWIQDVEDDGGER